MKRRQFRISDIFVIGFAMFAVFFGAGNLIFPPFLGLASGKGWFTGFLCFVTADVGLAIFTMLLMVRRQDQEGSILSNLGSVPSKLINVLVMLCVGPLLCVPRTCATTFEMAVLPLLPQFPAWLFSVLFFVVVFLLTIRSSKVVDIIGKVLTPLLLLTLAVLCVKGMIQPIGEIAEAAPLRHVIKEGFLAGYQTMDVFGSMVMTLLVLGAAARKGYTERKLQFRVVALSSVVAAACLFLVYGALTYLGATTSTTDVGDVNQAGLVVLVTELLLKRLGVYLLALIVFFACLTTAVGLVSSTAEFFTVLLKKVSYWQVSLAICLCGAGISSIGISAMIRFATPLLNVVYPLLLTQIGLSAAGRLIRKKSVFRGAAIGALAYCLPEAACTLGLPLQAIYAMPLSALGFGWVLPALIGALIGLLLPEKSGSAASTVPGTPEQKLRPKGEPKPEEDCVTIITMIPPAISNKQ